MPKKLKFKSMSKEDLASTQQKAIRQHPAYSEKEIWGIIRTVAERHENLIGVSHIRPRAYCLAKPAPHLAVFAVPLKDRERFVKEDEDVTVQNESCRHVEKGDWAALAYVRTSDGTGANEVVFLV